MVGIDIVFIPRIKEKINNERFYNKILNDIEIGYISKNKKANKNVELDSIAGFFAAKEAVLKAFGVGITNGYGFLDVIIDHDEFGAPVVKLSDKLNKFMKLKGRKKVNLSISHDGDYATAIAILEWKSYIYMTFFILFLYFLA